MRLRQFRMDVVEVGHLEGPIAGWCGDLRQALDNADVVQCIQIFQGKPTLVSCPSKIQLHRVSRYPVHGGNFALTQAAVSSPDNSQEI